MSNDASGGPTVLDAASQYIRRGWAPVPLPAGRKKPALKDWPSLRLEEQEVARHFSQDANIGLILGEASGWLVDVDLDCHEAVELADQYLPPTPAVTGRPHAPNSHRWYIANGAKAEKHTDPHTRKMIVELRSTGGQTVVGPSIHPDDGDMYEMLEGEPAIVPAPMLTACVAALAQAVVKVRYGDSRPAPKQSTPTERRVESDDADIERRATAYLDALPPAISGQGGHAATYAAATALVHGFGIGRERALHLLLTHFNPHCEPPWTEKELCHKVEDAATKPHDRPFGWLRSSDQPDANGDVDISALVEATRAGGQARGHPATPRQKTESDEATDRPASPGPFPLELIERAPDIVRRAFDYYVETAVELQPVLFLASLIAATGAVLGHKVKDKSGLRTNVYTVGILPTGGGKEATREFAFKIFRHAGIEAMCGQEEFASDAGLITAVEQQNPILFQVDEFGRFMHCVKAGPTRNPHYYNIASVLLKFYGKANSVFRSKAYADAKRNKTISQPHVCVYGTTVRSNFWSAMDKDSLDGGFLPRTLLFEATEESSPGGEHETNPPKDVVEFFAFWANRKMSAGNLESVNPQPIVVPFSSEALEALGELRALQKSMLPRFDGLGVLWSRARENAGKLAMIYGCWKQRDSPAVDIESASWAIDVVTHVIKHTLYEAFLCVAESPFHERCLRIMQAIERAAGQRLRHRELTRATRSMTPREREEALQSLIEQGRVTTWTEDTGGRRAVWYGTA